MFACENIGVGITSKLCIAKMPSEEQNVSAFAAYNSPDRKEQPQRAQRKKKSNKNRVDNNKEQNLSSSFNSDQQVNGKSLTAREKKERKAKKGKKKYIELNGSQNLDFTQDFGRLDNLQATSTPSTSNGGAIRKVRHRMPSNIV